MRRRRVIVVVVVLALVAVVVALWPRGPKPCRATFEQVQEGMTYDEVCATVGGPPGDYTTDGSGRPLRQTLPIGLSDEWWSDDAYLSVRFDPDLPGPQVGAEHQGPGPPRALTVVVRWSGTGTFWGNIRARLGL
jgi:hypothetical protein